MSLLGTLGHIAGGVIGFATGGVPGAIAGAGLGPKPPSSLPSSVPGFGGFQMPFPVNGPGGIPLPGYNPGGGNAPVNGQCQRGYHLNKHALAASKRHGAVPAHSICVRNRSINPLNARAITRSLKRVKRANKIIRKLHAFGPVHRSPGTAVARRK